jgi:uncharacterized membrane protein YhiD involved in acid resistance
MTASNCKAQLPAILGNLIMTVMVVTVQQVHHSVILVLQDVPVQPNKMTKRKKTKAKKKKKTKNEMQTKAKEKMKITDSSGENGVKDVSNEIELMAKLDPLSVISTYSRRAMSHSK